MADQQGTRPPRPGTVRWGVTEVVGNKFSIEFECCDAYDAIEFAEVCAAGLAEGELTIEVSNDGSE
jgi:hypothetical protein